MKLDQGEMVGDGGRLRRVKGKGGIGQMSQIQEHPIYRTNIHSSYIEI